MDKNEFKTISEIADRAVALYDKLGRPRRKMDIVMDIGAVHKSIGLSLGSLLDADDGNFSHDVFGIGRYLNRNTNTLTSCFVPRFAKRE